MPVSDPPSKILQRHLLNEAAGLRNAAANLVHQAERLEALARYAGPVAVADTVVSEPASQPAQVYSA